MVEGRLVLGCHFSLESDGRFMNGVGMDAVEKAFYNSSIN